MGVSGLTITAFRNVLGELLCCFKFEVPTQQKTTANIDKVLAGPGAGDYFHRLNFISV
jgi:hypothetical protein